MSYNSSKISLQDEVVRARWADPGEGGLVGV